MLGVAAAARPKRCSGEATPLTVAVSVVAFVARSISVGGRGLGLRERALWAATFPLAEAAEGGRLMELAALGCRWCSL